MGRGSKGSCQLQTLRATDSAPQPNLRGLSSTNLVTCRERIQRRRGARRSGAVSQGWSGVKPWDGQRRFRMRKAHLQDELPVLRASLRLGKKDAMPTVSLYDVKFYPYCEPGVDPVFGVAGADCVWICRPVFSKTTSIEVLRCFKDEQITAEHLKNKQHQLNSLCWSTDAATGDPLVIVASDVQKIKILNVKTGQIVRTLIGHGSDINDLGVSPVNPMLLASASMDYTVRLWNLSPEYADRPCVAICAGDGQREGLLASTWHRSGRFLLTGGHDSVVNLWAIPDFADRPAHSDRVEMMYYPHFSSNEVHPNYVHCLQWYDDLILSRCANEDRIYLWRINGFNPDLYEAGNAIPPAPAPELYRPSFTRSAFGNGFTRLLTFEVKHTSLIYQRFSIFHMPDKRPVLCAGNDRSKVHFWDLQRLEEQPLQSTTVGIKQEPSLDRDDSVLRDEETPATGDEDSRNGDSTRDASGLFRVPSRRKREADLLHTAVSSTRATSVASDAATSIASGPGISSEHPVPVKRGRGRKPGNPDAATAAAKFDISDPFRPLKAHKESIVPKVTFCVRQVAWSPGGEWCVVCGDNGMLALYSRWLREEG